MADRLQESYTQSVRCLICARPVRRGATLCAHCKAAVGRARHTPDVKREYLPNAQIVRTEARRSVERNVAYSRVVRRASRATPTPALGGWGIYATIIAFGLAVCLTGYLAIGENERNFSLGRGAATPPVQAEAQAARAAKADARDRIAAKAYGRVDTVARAGATVPSVAADSDTFDEPAADEHLALFESLTPASPRVNPDRKAAREGRGVRRANAALGSMDARNTGFGPTPLAAMPVAAAPATLAEPLSPNRWQQLAAALFLCERENVIAGLVCKERARLQYCEGEWGAAPQCPAAVLSLNTR